MSNLKENEVLIKYLVMSPGYREGEIDNTLCDSKKDVKATIASSLHLESLEKIKVFSVKLQVVEKQEISVMDFLNTQRKDLYDT